MSERSPEPIRELANYYLAHSARADMYRRLGRTAEARSSYEKALALIQQEPERQFPAGADSAVEIRNGEKESCRSNHHRTLSQRPKRFRRFSLGLNRRKRLLRKQTKTPSPFPLGRKLKS